ncbi:hypothetical protein BABINDRAFT_163431 [Babjeviella inositovora NRRL Y-12698]|uniref:Kinesin-like protein KIP1 n=1 Tax=Babjeviella inositovora NRRL Y-12698 TaxID=984486 RepID=A0A1E3QL55_9ASCO|nr:uncharacterized protein BABINDRAFT_163431 [Babjeviella inositovora NRRL Y-12698]ODQ77727.1 hypothetical protein BABINDRAFT_163431 [Babjeviella inositovora NRRL Y-12698]
MSFSDRKPLTKNRLSQGNPRNSLGNPHSLSNRASFAPQISSSSPSPVPKAEESNISVYVRCRSRNAREVREASGVVVSTMGHKGREVVLQTGPMAISNKTYTFDRVFGAESDQETVFDGIAANLLRETLEGYNCTVFAYGQTGTGKTYTMSGDISTAHDVLSENAGIIPRTLVSLFKSLEQQSDFSVKVSFIELYNEELRDLLVSDPSRKVRIYDDPLRKSIAVQGMEERYITSASEGLKLLAEGSYRRQVASTQCNDLSSRSHSVFTLTVHMKTTDPSGEELVKVGKLNLVDLAGSENINRSGAENKRAREAGMINQSLLTLGRVINALVEQSPHVPYRESKLTRLLQDSLGGKTKTCIIATISPAKVSLDETMSTLEYANRAKSIKNKPQVNQSMSKKLSVAEYTAEISRLKSELDATRLKNGIYLAEDAFRTMEDVSESRRIQTEEQRLRIELLEEQARKYKGQFEAQSRVIAEAERAYQASQTALEDTKKQLHDTEARFIQAREALNVEVAVRDEYARTEEALVGIHAELSGMLDECVREKEALSEMVSRKGEVQGENIAMWKETQTSLLGQSKCVQEEISQFEYRSSELLDSLSTDFSSAIAAENEKLVLQIDGVARIGDSFALKMDHIVAKLSLESNTVDEAITAMSDVKNALKDEISGDLARLQARSDQFKREVLENVEEIKISMQMSYHAIGTKFKLFCDTLLEHVRLQERQVADLRGQVEQHRASFSQTIGSKRDTLDQRAQQQKDAGLQQQQSLLAGIALLVAGYSQAQQQREEDTFGAVTSVLSDLATTNNAFAEGYAEHSTVFSSALASFQTQLKQDRRAIKEHLIEQSQLTSVVMGRFLEVIAGETLECMDQDRLEQLMRPLDDFSVSLKRANVENIASSCALLEDVTHLGQQSFSAISRDLQEFNRNLVGIEPVVSGFVLAQAHALGEFRQKSTGMVDKIQGKLTATELRLEDSQVPERKSYEYTRVAPRTVSRETVMQRMLENKLKTGPLKIVPVPVDDTSMDDIVDVENQKPVLLPVPDRPFKVVKARGKMSLAGRALSRSQSSL